MKKNKRETDFIYDELDKMSEEELNREMEKILAEVNSDEEVANAKVPESLYGDVCRGIRELESERAREKLSDEDKELLQYGRIYKRQLKYRKYVGVAAVLMLLFAMGITSMGGPRRLIQKMTGMLSGREQEMVDSNDGSVSETSGWTEEAAYDEIEAKFGFRPVKLDYLPEGTIFEEFNIGDEIQGAQIFYAKNEKAVILVRIQSNNRTSSYGIDVEDIFKQEYTIEKGTCEIKVKEYYIEDTREQRWTATFTYENGHYVITGFDIEKQEFEKIINNLVFA